MKQPFRSIAIFALTFVLQACQHTTDTLFVDQTGLRHFLSLTANGELSFGTALPRHSLYRFYPKYVVGDTVCFGSVSDRCLFAYLRECRTAFVRVSDGEISSRCIEPKAPSKVRTGYSVYISNPPFEYTAEEIAELGDEARVGKPNYRLIEFDSAGRLVAFSNIDYDGMALSRAVIEKGSFRFED